jgi:6-phosphogluconolactonase
MAQTTIIPGASDGAIARWLEARLAGGSCTISLPGGSTPFPILGELAGLALDWSELTVWPGDDRIVPEEHPASNTGRMRALLAPLGARVVPLVEGAQPPHFRLVWLGMGGDGHIASLFPNADPRADAATTVQRLRPDPLPPEAPFDRLSLTIPALLNADELLFVIRGADKRALFEAALRGENDLPIARLLKAARQPVTCFC